MLTTIEAEIEPDGSVTFLEPLRISKKSRAIITLLDDEKPPKREMSEAEAQLAEERFARHFGAISSGNPRSADNEQIDADLAREYGATHDDE
ncbi:MAG: hypothetical protein LC768_16170 [Acidobacteria bacterium]|nr:hypothetical protein [Acidobacteriota bacterium]MCA1639836.1 hypothetical protein [Acidobacteriota bacterium]